MTTYGTIPTSPSPIGTNLEYISRAKQRLRSGLGTRRPWKEMLNYQSFGLPATVANAILRIRTNIAYFRMNYAIAALMILFLGILWHPISLIVFIVMMAVWLFLYFLRDEPLVIFGRTVDDHIVLIVLAVLTIVFLLLTGATVNILVGLVIGAALVAIHGVFRRTDDLFEDEDSAGTLFAGSVPSSS